MRTSRWGAAHRCGPNGGSRPLALAQLLLGGERQAREVGHAAHLAAHAAQPLGIEAARRLEVRQLPLERDHSRGGSSPAAALATMASTVPPYASIATRRSASGVSSSFVCDTGGDEDEKIITVGIRRAISAAS